MNKRSAMCLAAVLGFLSVPVGHATPSTGVQIEISFLLGYVEGSGCEFYRNGTWHNAQEAQAHLRSKYSYLSRVNLIDTTEDFIDRAATKSSISGQPYQVKCHGDASVTSSRWLSDELARLRTYR